MADCSSSSAAADDEVAISTTAKPKSSPSLPVYRDVHKGGPPRLRDSAHGRGWN